MEGEQEIRRASRPRWWFHLVLLGLYPVVGGLLPTLTGGERETALLPRTVPALLTAVALELTLFTAVFMVAWWASRASAEQLLLKWREGLKPLFRGFFYAIGLRLVLAVAVMLVAFVVVQLAGVEPETLERMQPRGDAMVETQVLASDPLYLALCLTLVSFVLAGFREELWRAGVLAGMIALFPEFFRSLPRQLIAVAIAAVLFGLGHWPQGPAAALMTTLLGFGLGAIMVYHRSIWDAVFAHGFFNAGTFLFMYLLATRAPHLIPGG
jgi:membrane protease YdiL (CAAX protease family)